MENAVEVLSIRSEVQMNVAIQPPRIKVKLFESSQGALPVILKDDKEFNWNSDGISGDSDFDWRRY